MTKAIAIRTMGDAEIATAISDSWIAQENQRLRKELARTRMELEHQRERVFRYNRQRLAEYQPRHKKASIVKRIMSALIVKEV